MYLWTFCVIATEYYLLLSSIKNIVDMNGNKQFVQEKYNSGSKSVTQFSHCVHSSLARAQTSSEYVLQQRHLLCYESEPIP